MPVIDLIEHCLQGKIEAILEFNLSSQSVTELQNCLDHLQRITAMDARYSQSLFLKGAIYGKLDDNQHAISYLEEAIALGNAWAMSVRASMHKWGEGGPVNYALAIALYERGIALGNVFSMNDRALMHCEGVGGSISFAAAAALFYQAFSLGLKQSLEFLKNLASSGKPEGGQYLALAYEHQIASSELPDNEKRLIFHTLGKLYEKGIAGVPDFNKASYCYYRAYRDFKDKMSLNYLKDLAYTYWTVKPYLGLAYLAHKHIADALQVSDFLHNHPETQKLSQAQPIWPYLQFKLHLQGLRGTKSTAYDYYQAYPALKELLTTEDYYELGNMLLHNHLSTPHATSADSACTLLQASQCFYQAHQRGDSEVYPVLIQCLRQRDTLSNRKTDSEHEELNLSPSHSPNQVLIERMLAVPTAENPRIYQLRILIQQLIMGIVQKSQGRSSWFVYQQDSKVQQLQHLYDKITQPTPNPIDETGYLQQIEQVCAIKRNTLGFFKPHSLNQFHNWVAEFHPQYLRKF